MKNQRSLTLGLSALLAGSLPHTVFSADRDNADAPFDLEIASGPPLREGALGGYADVVDTVSPSVVSVMGSRFSERRSPAMYYLDPRTGRYFKRGGGVQREEQPQGVGSGVVITADGFIVTNNHVVAGADEVKVALGVRGDVYDAEIVGTDKATDLAVLKIDAEGLTPAQLGDSSLLKVGDFVLAMGSPFGLSRSVTTGVVSALGRTNLGLTGETGYEDFIQTDASINPGNSGGALVDNRGRVIGINTAIFSRTGGNHGIGFAIPSSLMVGVAEQLVEYGEVQRGFLGVSLGDVTMELSEAMGSGRDGAFVHEVSKGSPAEAAGFVPGDIVLNYAAKPIRDSAKLRLMVGATRPGTEIECEVLRDGEKIKLGVVIGAQDGGVIAASNQKPLRRWGSVEREALLAGVEVAELTDPLRSRLSLPPEIDGVFIESVAPGSPAESAGLQPGEIITEVARQPVTSYDEALEAKEAAAENGKGALLLRVMNERGSRFVAVDIDGEG